MTDTLVDKECNIPGVSLFCDEKNIYSCFLNQTNIKTNNNKFYIIQLLKEKDNFILYTRYGRVGETGTIRIDTIYHKGKAIKDFNKKFFTKTGNSFSNKDKFVQKNGKYTLMEMEDIELPNDDREDKESTLDKIVQEFILAISDKDTMNEAMLTYNIDTKKMPLGKISTSQIKKGFYLLKVLKDYINFVPDPELNLPNNFQQDTQIKLSSKFWTLIPYACGRKSPPIIDTNKKINEYSQLLELMENLEIAVSVMKNNNVDDIYSRLSIDLHPVNRESKEWEIIDTYISNTHGETHGLNLKISEILSIDKNIPDNNFFRNEPNHKLLFHGSRTANYLGILSEGLRVPNPHQVSNGSVLGMGVYFADSITKSFNYCRTSDVGYILLCEVALGQNPEELTSATFDTIPLPEYTSRIAYGKSQPSEIKNYQGVDIPLGKLEKVNIDSGFLYNEYVIFDPRRYKFKYVVKLEI